MSEAENKEVVVTESAQVAPAEPTVEIAAPVAAASTIKPASEAKHAARKIDRFAERRAELKRQKRVAHRRRIAASNTPG